MTTAEVVLLLRQNLKPVKVETLKNRFFLLFPNFFFISLFLMTGRKISFSGRKTIFHPTGRPTKLKGTFIEIEGGGKGQSL